MEIKDILKIISIFYIPYWEMKLSLTISWVKNLEIYMA